MDDYSIFLSSFFSSSGVILLEQNKQWDHNPHKTHRKCKSLLDQIKMTYTFFQSCYSKNGVCFLYMCCDSHFRKFLSECKSRANHENYCTNLIWSNRILKCFTECHWIFMFSNSLGFKSSLFSELLLNKMVQLLETHGHPQLQIPGTTVQ